MNKNLNRDWGWAYDLSETIGLSKEKIDTIVVGFKIFKKELVMTLKSYVRKTMKEVQATQAEFSRPLSLSDISHVLESAPVYILEDLFSEDLFNVENELIDDFAFLIYVSRDMDKNAFVNRFPILLTERIVVPQRDYLSYKREQKEQLLKSALEETLNYYKGEN